MIWRKKINTLLIKKRLNYIQTILSYCFKSRKTTESKIPKVVKSKNRIIMLLSKYAVCDNKKSKFIKEQEAEVLLSKLPGMTIPIINDLPIANIFFKKYKINTIVKKLLLARDKFMPEMHLRQPRFTYSACGPFT